jgi:hypothetical protein
MEAGSHVCRDEEGGLQRGEATMLARGTGRGAAALLSVPGRS